MTKPKFKRIPKRYRRAIRYLFGPRQMEKMHERYGVTPRSLIHYLQLSNKNRISMESLWIAKIVPTDFEDKDEEDYPPGSVANSYAECLIPPPLPLDSSQSIWSPLYIPSPLPCGKEELQEEESPHPTKPEVKCDVCYSLLTICACPSCDLCLCSDCDKNHSNTCRKKWFNDRKSENKGEKERRYWIINYEFSPPEVRWYDQLDLPKPSSTFPCDLCKSFEVTSCPSCHLCVCPQCYFEVHGPCCHIKNRLSRLNSIANGNNAMELLNKAKIEALRGPPMTQIDL
jgi:hypothetical protein